LIFPHYGKGVIQSSTVLLLLCGAWLLCRQLFTKSKACMLSCVQVSNTHVRRSPTLMCAGLQHSCAQVSNTHVRRSPTLMCAGLQHSCAQVSNTLVRRSPTLMCAALQECQRVQSLPLIHSLSFALPCSCKVLRAQISKRNTHQQIQKHCVRLIPRDLLCEAHVPCWPELPAVCACVCVCVYVCVHVFVCV